MLEASQQQLEAADGKIVILNHAKDQLKQRWGYTLQALAQRNEQLIATDQASARDASGTPAAAQPAAMEHHCDERAADASGISRTLRHVTDADDGRRRWRRHVL